MRKRVYISFHVEQSEGKRFALLMKSIGCEELWQEHNDRTLAHLAHVFKGDDPRLHSLVSLLRQEGMTWFERVEHVYLEQELRGFPFLILTVNRKPLDAGGGEYGTTFDLSRACPRCGTGAIQTSPLLLPLTGLPKKGLLCEAAHGEILVAAPLADALRENNVTGLELRQVRLYANGEPLPWWQMVSQHEMPRMHPETRGVLTDEVDHLTQDGAVIRTLHPCPECRQDGRYATTAEPFELAYSEKVVKLSELPDVVHTWERFGRSGIDPEDPRLSHFAVPLLLVRPRIFDIFRRLKVRHARFEPVRLVK
jgi:hypothetical protein